MLAGQRLPSEATVLGCGGLGAQGREPSCAERCDSCCWSQTTGEFMALVIGDLQRARGDAALKEPTEKQHEHDQT